MSQSQAGKTLSPNIYAARDLTREMIVEAAVPLLRESGVEKFSMRRLAAELNVSATALYYYVANKEDLLDAVATGLLRSAASVGEELPWDAALEELLVRMQYLGSEYPGILVYLAGRLESSATLLWMELILRVLKRGGLDGEAAATALTVVGFYNSAVPLRGHPPAAAGPWEQLHPEVIATRLQELGEEYATLAGMLTHIRQPDEALFRLGLRSLIAGLKRGPGGGPG